MNDSAIICKQAEAQFKHHAMFWDARRNGEAAALFTRAPYAEIDLDVYNTARRAARSALYVLDQAMSREERWQWTGQEPRGAKAARVAHAYGEATALLVHRTLELATWERSIGCAPVQTEAAEGMAYWTAKKAAHAAGVVLDAVSTDYLQQCAEGEGGRARLAMEGYANADTAGYFGRQAARYAGKLLDGEGL